MAELNCGSVSLIASGQDWEKKTKKQKKKRLAPITIMVNLDS